MTRLDPDPRNAGCMMIVEGGDYVLFEDWKEENKIVARLWDILGRPSYEQLEGRSIYDLVQGLKIAAEGYRKGHSISCTNDSVCENRCRWCKIMDALPVKETITPSQQHLTDEILVEYANGKYPEDVKWRGQELAAALLSERVSHRALRLVYKMQNGYTR